MIIKKLDDNSFISESKGEFIKIPSKEVYLAAKEEILSIEEPSDKELIALGKEFHPYYRKENDLFNIENNIKEIEEFENPSPVVIDKPIIIKK